jgi:hypothetical protein
MGSGAQQCESSDEMKKGRARLLIIFTQKHNKVSYDGQATYSGCQIPFPIGEMGNERETVDKNARCALCRQGLVACPTLSCYTNTPHAHVTVVYK